MMRRGVMQARRLMQGKATGPLDRTWYPALRASESQRAVMAVVGDSIADGYSSTNFESTDFVSLLRANLQSSYGDGGEGFVSAIHSGPSASGWEAPPANRWTFGAGSWTRPGFATRDGYGMIAGGGCYWNSTGVEPQTSGVCTTLQVMTAVKFQFAAQNLLVSVDGTPLTPINLGGGQDDYSQLIPGFVVEYTGFADVSHAVKFDTTGNYVWVEGVRFLRGSAGVVVDRMAKPGMRAEWLGTANDSDYTHYMQFYKTLHATLEVLGNNLIVIMLGVNDYIGQVALNTFETAMGVIAARAKGVCDTVIVAPPKIQADLTIPYSSYVTRLQNVAAANDCLFLSVYERWGSAYKADFMANATHPNNAGHADIATYLAEELAL